MKVMFGKHKGKDLTEVPTDYLEWMLSLGDLSEVYLGCVRRELDSRRDEVVSGNQPAVRGI